MGENAQHEISTIAELVEAATSENVETLAADLAQWLRIHVALKGAEPFVTMGRVFLWNDDGVQGVQRVLLRPTTDQEGNE